MQQQKEMENAMLKAHRAFMIELGNAVKVVEREIGQAEDMKSVCTDEWCRTTELYLDDLHKSVYAISEPRFATSEDHEQIKKLRNRVKDLYFRFKTHTPS